MVTNRLLGEFADMRSPISVVDGDMGELSLILPAWQIVALEAQAHNLGVTTAQMVRQLIHDYFSKCPALETCER